MTDETLARMTFQDLIRDINFWKSQWVLFAIFGVSILLILGLWNFTYPSIEQLSKNSGMGMIFAIGAIFIHPILLFGAWIMLRLIADLQIEHATARIIKEKVDQKLIDIERPDGIKPTIEELDIDCLPAQVESQPKNNMILLFDQIQKDAKVLRFESPLVVTQPYQERFEARLVELNGAQRYALTLGILGTFLGILLALTSIDKSIADLSVDSISQLMTDFSQSSGDIFGALRISFRTSVAGLEVYIIIGLMLLYVHRQLRQYFFTMEEMASNVLSLAKLARKDDFLGAFEDVNTRIEGITEDLSQHNKQIDFNLRRVETRLENQTHQIQHGLDRLKETREEFDQFLDKFGQFFEKSVAQQQAFNQGVQETYQSFQHEVEGLFKRLSETQHQFIEDVRQVYDLTSMKELGERLENNVKQTVGDLSQTFHAHIMLVDDNVSTINKNLNTLTSNMQQLVNQTYLVNETLKEVKTTASKSAQANLEKQLEKMDALLQLLTQLTKNTGILSNTVESSISNNINRISKHLQAFEQSASKQFTPQLIKVQTDTEKLRLLIEKINKESWNLPKTLKQIIESVKSMDINLVDYQKSSIHTSNRILRWAGGIVIFAGILLIFIGLGFFVAILLQMN